MLNWHYKIGLDEYIMSVKLIASTKMTDTFATENDLETLEEMIVHCSEYSSPDTQKTTKLTSSIIRNLIKHKHWSPLELVSVTLYIETSADIARKLFQHRAFTFQEVYGSVEDKTKDLEFTFKKVEHISKISKITLDEFEVQWISKQKKIIEAASDAYQWAIKHGAEHDVAKSVFPEGNVISRIYMQGNIRSYMHYIENIKESELPNKEKIIAEEIAEELITLFPTLIN